jgi:stage II sporulation protein D
VILEGVGQGHGVGLCQRGAKAMAQQGANFRDIIGHYFPNTSLGHIASHPLPESRMERQLHP